MFVSLNRKNVTSTPPCNCALKSLILALRDSTETLVAPIQDNNFLSEDGIQLVTGLRVNMKNKLMPFYDRMMLRKRYIIETINDMLKNTAQIVHSRHRSVSNFIMNLISALGAYCFFDNKPKALQGYCIEDTKQLSLF